MEKILTVVARIAEKRIVKYQYLWDPMTLTTANIKELAWTLEDPKHLLILNAHLVGKKTFLNEKIDCYDLFFKVIIK